MPDRDGVELSGSCAWSRVPIIVISARGREADKVEVLDAGADDYLTKPFGVGGLLARMRVALRQRAAGGRRADAGHRVGPLSIDLARREVRLDDAEVHLTPIEYRLLRAARAERRARADPPAGISEEYQGPGHAAETHYLRVYMAQLHGRSRSNPAQPRLLQTEPGRPDAPKPRPNQRSSRRCGGRGTPARRTTCACTWPSFDRKIESEPARPRLLQTEPGVGYRMREATS